MSLFVISCYAIPMARLARIVVPGSPHHVRQRGAPLLVVAKNLGHADTRMVGRRDWHLAPSYIAEAVRAATPRFGAPETNVVAIGD